MNQKPSPKMCKLTVLLLLQLLTAVQAVELNTAAIGRSKPSWKDLPGTDGQHHSLAELSDKDIVVIAVTCNHCPLALEYFDRLKQFAGKHAGKNGKAALVAISLSNQETDRLPRMKE